MKWVWLFVFLSSSCFAQSQLTNKIDSIAENLAVLQEEELHGGSYENLLTNLYNPLSLNEVTYEELVALNIITPAQCYAIIQYRARVGRFVSIYELQAVEDLSLTDLKRLFPFVVVQDGEQHDLKSLPRRLFQKGTTRLLLRMSRTIENSKGYKNDTYLGDPNKLYLRLRSVRANDYSFGFTLEKDAGETIDWNPEERKFGSDFISAHFQIQNKGAIRNLIAGDYQLQFGQSLLLGSGLVFGKTSNVINVSRPNAGIQPYTAVVETGFFRGAAATIQLSQHLEVTPFYSLKHEDASLRLNQDNEPFIRSFRQDGFHRTATERFSANSVKHQTAGSVLRYQNRHLQAGLAALISNFELPFQPSDQLYNRFSFTGDHSHAVSGFWNLQLNNLYVFGEVGFSNFHAFGGVGGATISLSPRLSMAVLYRNYSREFTSFYGAPISESSGLPRNEYGLYCGLKYEFSRKFVLSGYVDHFGFPWLRTQIKAVSRGAEYLIRADLKTSKGSLLTFQYRSQRKLDNLPAEINGPSRLVDEGIKENYLVKFDKKVSDIFELRSRIQGSRLRFAGNITSGMTLIQDIILSYSKLQLSSRFQLFDVDDFDNRQYAYERDVLYAFSIPAQQGLGFRYMFLLRYKISRALTFEAKWSRTSYRDREVIGSGNDQIDGNVRSDFKWQLRIQL